jgi:hypothetical protein
MSNDAGLSAFTEELNTEISETSSSENISFEEALFDTYADYLIGAGEFEEAQYAHYAPAAGGVRIDGFGGDPKDEAKLNGTGFGRLKLIIIDSAIEPSAKSLTNTEINAIFKRATNFVARTQKTGFRKAMQKKEPGYELADLIKSRWKIISDIKIYLFSNRAISSLATGKESVEIEGKSTSFDVWDTSRLYKLVSSGKEREDLVVDFDELPSGPLTALKASDDSAGRAVYLAALPGKDLAAIYDRWGTRLLEQNVRVFLQARSNVNKGIKKTLEEEPSLFFSYNNGLTATAESADVIEDGAFCKITRLYNFQIVNGGQTTASIYAASKSGVDISDVLVQLKLNVVSAERAKSLVPKISKYANSQNKVSDADLSSNSAFQVRMESYSRRIYAPAKEGSFQQTKWYYERARGQYRDEQSHLKKAAKKKFLTEYPKSQSFTKTDLAKYLMVWTDEAYYVNRGAQKNFTEFARLTEAAWNKDPDQFNERFYRHSIAKKIIFNETERIVTDRPWYEAGGYRSQHVVLAIAYLANAVKDMHKSIDFDAIWRQQAISDKLTEALEMAADAADKVLMSPQSGYRNISEWAKQEKCLRFLCSHFTDWDEAWISELISSEEEAARESKARDQQAQNNAIAARKRVLSVGTSMWSDVISWIGASEAEVSDEGRKSLAAVSAKTGSRFISDEQCLVLAKLMDDLRDAGCPYLMKR